MDKSPHLTPQTSHTPRICLFSQRHLQRLVSRCAEYEFEDIICQVDDAHLLTPEPHQWFTPGQKVSSRLAQHLPVHPSLGVRKLRLAKAYDLFVAICQFPRDVLSINAVKDWKTPCRTSICWIAEIWAGELPKLKGILKILSQFDYVIIPCKATLEPLKNVLGKRCVYIAPGIDTLNFCPYPNPPARCIDVYSMGRKSLITHQALLKMAEQKRIFYIYDTCECMQTLVPQQHRSLLANTTKRTRYFITNAPKINRTFETKGQTELSYRLLEGAASGAIMIGAYPESIYQGHFSLPDAVIQIPFDAPDIDEIIAALDSQPERLKAIRIGNITDCLLRHDWIYRWRQVLEMAGLEPSPALLAREKRLKHLAESVNQDR